MKVTAQHDQVICELWDRDFTVQEIADKLNLSYSTVYGRRRVLQLPDRIDFFSEADTALLIELSATCTDEQIATRLGRSYASVHAHRDNLRKKGIKVHKPNGVYLRPFTIPSTAILLARTCPRCGHLKNADQYRPGRARSSVCRTCKNERRRGVEHGYYERQRDKTRARTKQPSSEKKHEYSRAYYQNHKQRLNEIARQRYLREKSDQRYAVVTAAKRQRAKERRQRQRDELGCSRNGLPWTPADNATVLRDDLTTVQMAVMLQRSPRVVSARRTKLRRTEISPDKPAWRLFTAAEDEWVRDTRYTNDELAQILDRSAGAISGRRHKLGVKIKPIRRFTAQEDQLIRDTNYTTDELARILGRTFHSIVGRRRKLGVKIILHYTAAEDEWVRDTSYTSREVAGILGRSLYSVKGRRQNLGVKVG